MRERGARVHHYLQQYGYPGLFALLAAGVLGLPIPDETLLAMAGWLARRGDLHPVATVAVATAGSLCGLTISFILGRIVGVQVIHRFGPWLHISAARFTRFHTWYQRRGGWLITFGYFVPGFRHVVAIIAGSSALAWRLFLPFAAVGAFLWVTTFISLGYTFGREWQTARLPVRLAMIGLGAGLTAAGVIVARVRRRLARRINAA